MLSRRIKSSFGRAEPVPSRSDPVRFLRAVSRILMGDAARFFHLAHYRAFSSAGSVAAFCPRCLLRKTQTRLERSVFCSSETSVT